MPCSLLSCNRRFGGTYRLHLQGRSSLIATCLLAGSCWNFFFDPEDGSDMFLRNFGCNLTDYTASHRRRWYSSWPPPWKPQILQYTRDINFLHWLWWWRRSMSPKRMISTQNWRASSPGNTCQHLFQAMETNSTSIQARLNKTGGQRPTQTMTLPHGALMQIHWCKIQVR
jgi:hypothetical protein